MRCGPSLFRAYETAAYHVGLGWLAGPTRRTVSLDDIGSVRVALGVHLYPLQFGALNKVSRCRLECHSLIAEKFLSDSQKRIALQPLGINRAGGQRD